jgi:fission 1 protein
MQHHRPLNPAELAVLRTQYEKEGDMVGVQTKFNYAWVGLQLLLLCSRRPRAR